jgi:16S rRNA (guanine966-N2)-methyltransferase
VLAGAWRGRRLRAPSGLATRPTSVRLRQAVFDMLAHAAWSPPGWPEGARVLDAFAGTGAFGLECLSRGAAHATFLENDRAALAVLRANVEACGAGSRARVLPADALAPPRGTAMSLVFLDPPWQARVLPRAIAALAAADWIGDETLVLAEHPQDESRDEPPPLATRAHGAGAVTIWRGGAWR